MPVEDGTAAPVTDQHVSVRVNVVDLLDAHLVQHTKQTTPLSENTHNDNNNRDFIERLQRLKAFYDLIKQNKTNKQTNKKRNAQIPTQVNST